jgi:hypothetical protein
MTVSILFRCLYVIILTSEKKDSSYDSTKDTKNYLESLTNRDLGSYF